MSIQKPVLYYTPRSPPCRSVLLTAAALDLDLELVVVNLKEGEHMKPEFLKMNPQHTIPVLDDKGTIVSDSHVICGYLVDTYGKNDSLYPKDSGKRRLVDTRLYFECGHLFPRVRFMVEPIIYFGVSEITKDRIEYMQKSWDGLEKCLANSSYLCGETLTIADLCCASSVSTGKIFAPIDPIKFPKLTSWLNRLAELPYYQKCNQDGADILGKFIKETLAERQKANN